MSELTPDLDLDARRAARREALGEARVVRFGGEDFLLPVELDVDTADGFYELLGNNRPKDALAFLLGAEQWERFWSHRPTYTELGDLMDAIPRLYGVADEQGGSGKSPASSAPSTSTGKRSRRTSRGSTG